MKRGDIYLVTLDPTEGREQQGYRPVLVISPQAFNEATKLPVILPITAGGEFTSFPRRSVGTRKRTPTFVSARPHCAAPLQTTPSKRNAQRNGVTSFPRSRVGMPSGGRVRIPTQERGNENSSQITLWC